MLALILETNATKKKNKKLKTNINIPLPSSKIRFIYFHSFMTK